MGRRPCLFVCYGKQELRQEMDGGGSDYIEERFAKLTVEGKIRSRMKERGGRFFLV